MSTETNQPTPAQGAGAPPGTILIVDDEEDIAGLLQSLISAFADEPYDVTIETSAPAALKRVKTQPFDLVLSDFRMPDVDGLTILAAARAKHPRGCRALMSGYNEMPITQDSLERARPDAHLHKPFDAPQLLGLLAATFADDSKALDGLRAAASLSLSPKSPDTEGATIAVGRASHDSL